MKEQFIITTEDQMEAFAIKVSQRVNNPQSIKEDLPEFIGTPEARKLLEKILGMTFSDSWFAKKAMNHELPFTKMGKRRVFNRAELIDWAKSKVARPADPVAESVTATARKREAK